jgi:hypothetical protein
MILFPFSISVRHPQGSVIHVTYGKRQNGGVGQMEQELCVMHVACVSVCSLSLSATHRTFCSHPRVDNRLRETYAEA